MQVILFYLFFSFSQKEEEKVIIVSAKSQVAQLISIS